VGSGVTVAKIPRPNNDCIAARIGRRRPIKGNWLAYEKIRTLGERGDDRSICGSKPAERACDCSRQSNPSSFHIMISQSIPERPNKRTVRQSHNRRFECKIHAPKMIKRLLSAILRWASTQARLPGGGAGLSGRNSLGAVFGKQKPPRLGGGFRVNNCGKVKRRWPSRSSSFDRS
jgi:hypothetical protein